MDKERTVPAELKGLIRETVPSGKNQYLAIFSDHVEWAEYNLEALDAINVEKLLELRVFNSVTEFRALRATIGEEGFACRFADDSNLPSGGEAPDFVENYFDEVHFLDIDLKRSYPEDGEYRTTGGGPYTLPVCNAERVMIRNYIEYDDEGIALVKDFRIVGVIRAGEEEVC